MKCVSSVVHNVNGQHIGESETDPTCLLCGAAEENVIHFILQCEQLQSERVALLSEINAIWQNEFQNNENFTDLSEVDQLQLLMNNIRSR